MKKDEARKKLKEARALFKGDERRFADGEILKNFLRAFAGYESYFIYRSKKPEADTRNIISALLSADKRVYSPRVEGDNMVAVQTGANGLYRLSRFGVEEPVGQAFTGQTDVCVIPLLGVNEKGYRLGYGGGYYDKYLKDNDALKAGIGYSFQKCGFEEEAHDIPLDCFVSEEGIIYFGAGQK